MKKYILPIVLVVVFAFYVLLNSRSSTTGVTVPPTTADNGSSTTPGSSTGSVADNTPSSTPTPTPTPTPAPKPAGQYKDGSYTGPVTDAFYGPMQVAAVVSGGKITDVRVLQSPGDQGESLLVNGRSNPILIQEALSAQSAKIDVVSGATQSSEAFMQSLAAALAKARA